MSGPPRLIDHDLLARRRARATREATPGADFLVRQAADDIAERLATVNRTFASAADIATPSPALARRLAETGQIGRIVTIDTGAAGAEETNATALSLEPQSLDLAVSGLALQWFDDLPGVLAQIRRALKPDGLLLVALLGGDTLTELRQAFAAAEAELTDGASPRVIPFVEVRAAGGLLQRAGFALPVADVDRKTVRYDSALDLMRDLRAMGATSPLIERSRTPMTRRLLERVIETYAERFSDPDGRVRATFDIVSLSGWAPAENQPKALRPGSATTRLADALGTVERSSGEKSGR